MATTRATNDRRWRTVWGVWIVWFGVAEWFAVKSRNPKAPLSYFLRHSLGIPHSPAHRWLGQIAAGVGLVWLIGHLWGVQPPKDG